MPAANRIVVGLGLTVLGCFACESGEILSQGSAGVGAPVLTAGGAAAGTSAGAGAGAGSGAGSGLSAGGGGRGTAGAAAAGSGSAGQLASGAAGPAGAAAGGGGGESAGSGAAGAAGSGAAPSAKFSFFVTSLGGMQELSGSDQGFGGDLRYGEDNGLAGADKICTELAERSLAGSGAKGWRAFLSTAKGGANDGPVHAKDRIGEGPWYDRMERLVAKDLPDLLQTRPVGADSAIANDLPNENGVPNHKDTVEGEDDNHDVVTGTNAQGMYDGTPTCSDWTSTATTMSTGGSGGRGGGTGGGGNGPRIGHSWPAQSGMAWSTAHTAPGCAPSVALVQMGGGSGSGIGNGGGYGGIYCFARKP